MKRTIWIVCAAIVAAGVVIAQGPAASPASQTRPKTVTEQTYPADQIQAGEQRFGAQCGFCHGRDAAGGELGPDLTRSALVSEDTRGDKIGPLLKTGRPDQGMPAFTLNAADQTAIVAFIHTQKTKFDTLGGGRRAVDPEDLAVGNAEAGRDYFEGACGSCHTGLRSLAGIAAKYRGLELLQRMLYPSGRPAPARPTASVKLGDGQRVTAPLAGEDEFTISILDSTGARKTYDKSAVTFTIDDPMAAHFTQLGKYTDKDMHDVFAYLDTLK
ncbi:MAG: c-type cytochrome [Acidobacteriota bacterium]